MSQFDSLSEAERKKMLSRLITNQKKFEDKEKEEQEKKSIEEQDYQNNTENLLLHDERKMILKRMGIGKDDEEVLSILENTDFRYKNYFIHFFVMTSIDSHCFVKEDLSISFALERKLLYLFGVNFRLETEENSKKNILYLLVKKISDLLEKSYTDYGFVETLNHYLAIIGGLGVATHYHEMFLKNQFSIAFHSSKRSIRFCYQIPPYNTETQLFKELYDFYFENISRGQFRKVLSEVSKNPENKKSIQQESVFKRNDGIFNSYDKMLQNKLGNLRKMGGLY